MNLTRRELIETLSLAAGLSAALPWRETRGAAPERLDAKDPAAAGLGYVENAAQVDVKKYPAFMKGSTCENCLLLQGSAGNDYRPCSVFPGKLVSVKGWCKSWTPEM
jgi:hypothetical protein